MSYGTPPPPPPGVPYGQPAGAQPAGDPGTLDLPWYGIGFADAVKRFFKKYARFDGRASRSEYWWSYLGAMLIWVPLYVLLLIVLSVATTTETSTDSYGITSTSSSMSTGGVVLVIVVGAIFAVAALGMLVPSLAIGVRRLHDAGFSGWVYLIGLIPCVSI